MSRSFVWFLAICLLIGTALIGRELSAAEKADKVDVISIMDALRSGGYVVYLRHGATDHSQKDAARVDFKKCGTQRNLSSKGRQQSRAIGRAFSQHGIHVENVISSPYCRAAETGRLAFGRVVISDDLKFSIRANKSETERRAAALRRMLATAPRSGQNTIIIAHTSNLKEAVGIWPKPEGVAVIFRPERNGTFKHVATVLPETWLAIANGE